MSICFEPDTLVEERIDRIRTQYRESPKFLHIIRTYLRAMETMHLQVCDLPERFDVTTAIGDQLTIVGKRLGWPRCHCVCTVQPVFGFECDEYIPSQPLAGFCESNSTWAGCGEFGTGDVCINDDELYRKFLFSRIRQAVGDFSNDSLSAACRDLWGPTGVLLGYGHGRVVVAPGRDLTADELGVLQLYPRVLPVAPGIEVRFHFGPTDRIFGFGDGWGGLCGVDTYPIETESGVTIQTESNVTIETDYISADSAWWMCQIDVRPYSC